LRGCELFGIPEEAARARFREFMTARAAPDAVVFPGRASAVSNIPIRVPEHYIGRDDALAAIEAALARHEGAVLTADRHCYAAGWSFLLFLGFLRGSDKVMLFPTRRRRMRQPIGYGRFACGKSSENKHMTPPHPFMPAPTFEYSSGTQRGSSLRCDAHIARACARYPRANRLP
jgi:hypothetical protein